MENEQFGPAQPEPVVESETLQEIRRTRTEIEKGVRHIEHANPASVREMMKTFDLLIALHLRHQNASVQEGE